MFNWLRKKALEASKKEYEKGLRRNINFLRFAAKNWHKAPKEKIELFSNVSEELVPLEVENNELNNSGYSEESMSRLLDLDMKCRRLWANFFNGSDLKYNIEFDPNKVK